MAQDAARFVQVVSRNSHESTKAWFDRLTTGACPEPCRNISVPQGSQLPDGTRQISASGPYDRGPGASAEGPAHHYVFELFALDAPIDVPPAGASRAQTRAAVAAAMAGHIRGKAACVGLFKRLR
jgi:phosphatidylethanolamine-binding protein (PEBP) family uncharacterized protein